ncbi:MAG TPA: adenylate/guanylate cyclase domain-containing protein [Gaiella sp.]|jgi:class 3 adenylate cyclase|nr:adenylate/guanylate cyclase domain-containing protein [Gaiella sp.]
MNGHTSIRSFLIADIRGYSRYTDEFGDEAAARLSERFVELVTDGVETHGGEVVEVRGDEALCVFTSARQAIRCAVYLQGLFSEEAATDHDLPLRVGMGIDSGEAVSLEDGGFRGAALNVAARLCGRAHGGEVIVSEATYRLAGRMEGLTFSDRGRVHLKNIADPIHVLQVYSEFGAEAAPNRWVLMFFGKPARQFGWKLAAGVAGLAALTAAGVVYLTTGDHTDGGSASPLQSGSPPSTLPANAGLDAIVPEAIWRDCHVQTVAEPAATQTAVCLPANGMPDRWEISEYPTSGALNTAYTEQVRAHPDIEPGKGKCNAFSWGGEHAWLHGPDKPGGHVLCYFEGDDAVIVWTHERLGQPSHKDILAIARESGSDHAGLTRWWRPWHHLIGKAN